MTDNRLKKDEIKEAILSKLQRQFGCDTSDATDDQIYQALAMTVRDEVMERCTALAGTVTSGPLKAELDKTIARLKSE